MGTDEDTAAATPADPDTESLRDKENRAFRLALAEWAARVGIDPNGISKFDHHYVPSENYGATYNDAKDGGHGFTIADHYSAGWVANGRQYRATAGLNLDPVGLCVSIRILADKQPRHPGEEYWYAADTADRHRRALWLERQWKSW
jgi:hypothetical protein